MHAAALLGAVVLATAARLAGAHAVVDAKWTSCASSYPAVDPMYTLNVQNVYAAMVSGADVRAQHLVGRGEDVLRIDLFGTLTTPFEGFNSSTHSTETKLAGIFTETSEAGVVQYISASYVCTSIWPATLPEPYEPGKIYCPLQPGSFGVNVSVPLANVHALANLRTNIRIVDADDSAQTLACVDVLVTPYEAHSWPYRFFFWFPVTLAIAYFIVTWSARFAAGWVIGMDRSDTARREATMLKWGTMLISGLSGERFGVSAALLRFVTPGLRDILHHIQFVTMLAMIRVNWPAYFYAIVSEGAWANLVWNVTIVSHEHPSVYPTNFTPPADFTTQLSDPKYPLYLNDSAEPRLLDLDHTRDGMLSFAKMVGLRPQDLFGTCLSLFLMLAAVIIVFSLLLWLIHCLTEVFAPEKRVRQVTPAPRTTTLPNRNSMISAHSRTSSMGKEWFDPRTSAEFGAATSTPPSALPLTRAVPTTKPLSKWHRIRKRFSPRGEAGAFHFSVLYGNLLRLILTFHFPITAFSVFQLTLSYASIVSRVLAALTLAFISVLIPALIMFKISRTPTGKLYDAARTLLSLGTMYNVYEPEKQLYRTLPLVCSLVSGIAIGAGQGSGLAQTIVLIVVELASFVATTFWSPWGQGASMRGVVVFVSIVRIGSIILTMVLSRELAAGGTTGEWLAYTILILQAIVFLFFFLMVCTKILESLIRLIGGAPFDESNHPIDGGIFAAIMDLDCLNGGRGGKAAQRRRRKRDSRLLQQNVSVAGSLTTQMMLDRHSQGIERQLDNAYSTNDRRGSYAPVQNPAMLPIDQFGNRRSMSDHGSLLSMSDENRATDPWRQQRWGETQPLTAASEKTTPMSSPQLGGGFSFAPSIHVTHDNPYRPSHGRARSSSAVMELLESSPALPMGSPPLRPTSASPPPGFPSPAYPPTAGVRADRSGNRPPPVQIPRRRSLNNIQVEIDEDRQNKRRSWTSANWFNRAAEAERDSDEDDDEPGPRRRRRQRTPDALEALPSSVPPPGRGWRALFVRKPKILDARAKAEKRARKKAAVNESGALLAGVDAPPPPAMLPTSRPISGQVPAAGAPTSFRVQRKGRPGSNPTTPLLAPPEQSFRVRRSSPDVAGLHSTTPPLPASSSFNNSITEEPEPPEPLREREREAMTGGYAEPSFNVMRGSGQTSATSVASSPPVIPPLDTQTGYAATLFVPLNDTPGGRRPR